MVKKDNKWMEFTVQAGGKSFIGNYDPASLQGGILVQDASFDHVADWRIDGSPATEARLTDVWIWESTFADLEGLDRFPNVRWLMITSSKIGSVAGIEKCTQLKVVDIRGCHLDSMAWVAPLANVERLDLGKNDITRIEGVANYS